MVGALFRSDKITFTGFHCEADKDGCADNLCSRECTDLPPEQEVNFKRAFNCTDCLSEKCFGMMYLNA